MHVWLITVGEPLPTLSRNSRLWRTGLLARQLVQLGHSITWWTSRVDHIHKEFFGFDGPALEAEPGLTLRFLDGRLYRRNISIARLVNHWQIGRDFRRRTLEAPRPGVVLCSFPTIELSLEAARFGQRHGVPVVLDIRDLWPDIFLQPAPAPVRPLVRLALAPYFAAARRALREATALVAVSDGYLQWGLAGAGRAQGSLDQLFPLAYSLPAPSAETRLAARESLRKFGVDDASIVCLFAGTLGRTYDLAPVLHAARKFAEEGDERFRFLICGDGERAREWRERASGQSNVTFTGWLAQPEMHAALVGADIGLAAYAKAAPQGVPNKVIEYLAAGLPVVSSLSGEAQALLARAECGRSYQAGDGEALSRTLRELEPGQNRERISRNARRKYEESFRAESVYGRLAAYLEELAASGGRPR